MGVNNRVHIWPGTEKPVHKLSATEGGISLSQIHSHIRHGHIFRT